MDPAQIAAYRAAYDAWIEQLQRLHAVLLEGEPLDPMRRIALLRRESHLHDRYEDARRRFLGLPGNEVGGSPFGE